MASDFAITWDTAWFFRILIALVVFALIRVVASGGSSAERRARSAKNDVSDLKKSSRNTFTKHDRDETRKV